MKFPQHIHPRSQVMGKRPSLYSRTYAESLGCDPEDTSEEILAKLRGLSVAKLQVRLYKLNLNLSTCIPYYLTIPVITVELQHRWLVGRHGAEPLEAAGGLLGAQPLPANLPQVHSTLIGQYRPLIGHSLVNTVHTPLSLVNIVHTLLSLVNTLRAAIMTGRFSAVPLLTGVCSEEGIMMVSHIVREPERWSLLAQDDWWKHLLGEWHPAS